MTSIIGVSICIYIVQLIYHKVSIDIDELCKDYLPRDIDTKFKYIIGFIPYGYVVIFIMYLYKEWIVGYRRL